MRRSSTLVVNQIIIKDQGNLLPSGHAQDSESILGVLLRLCLADDVGGVDLSVPSTGCEVSVPAPLGVIQADHYSFKWHC